MDSESDSYSEDDAVVVAQFLNLCKMYKQLKKKRKRRKRRWYARPINKDWSSAGYHRKVLKKMKDMDEEQFFIHTRMPRDLFDMLLSIVYNDLKRPLQRIGPEERLSITLFYLAHGNSIQSIAWSHKLGKTTVRNIILETCDVLWRLLSPIYVSEPTTSQYIDIEKDFKRMWNIPNCAGAIDGKHIAIKCPKNSGSMFHNYKKFFSIVLMGVCDANYTFLSASVGSYGSQSDGGIFRVSPFGESVLNNTVPLPPPKPLSTRSPTPFPHFFVGDAAFPLKTNLMRPYPGSNLDREKRIFNYRLSRARRVIENCFGILVARWRILLTTLECSPENSEFIVLACIALHNFIMLNDQKRWYCPTNFVDREEADGTVREGDWRTELSENGDRPLRSMTTHIRRSTENAIQLRNRLAEYFCNEGAIPFQNRV